jgi:serine/threonine-protein kinase
MDWEALQSQEDAYADYWEDFTYQLEKYTSSDTVDQGKIISQDPVQGTSVTGEKTTVSVTVSSGPETGQMLDVVGMTTSDARLALAELREKYGLRITTVSENSDTIDKELVCRTDPEAGFDLQKGDTVTLYISLGSTVKQLSVPDFTTMTKDGVSRALSTLKLNVEYMDDVPSDKPEGTIVYQSIAEGTMVDEGTTIILQASSGPQETTTPEEPTQSPESNQPDEPTPPSASTSVTRYWRTELHMPQASEGDSGSVHVTVTVDGTVVEESDFARDGSSHTLEIPGQGTQRVTIYLDGEQLNSQDVNFYVEGVIIE